LDPSINKAGWARKRAQRPRPEPRLLHISEEKDSRASAKKAARGAVSLREGATPAAAR